MDKEILKKFFDAIFLQNDDYFVEFRYKIPKGGVIQKFVQRKLLDKAIEEMVENEERIKNFEMWFGVCPRINRSGKKEDINQVNVLWCDIDDATIDYKNFEYLPNIVVNSGHGLHLYWILNKPFIINSPQDIQYIESILQGLTKYCGGDNTYDISRVLRIPETYNNKNQEDRKKVIIIHFDESFKYDLSQFEKYREIVKESIEKPSVIVEKQLQVDIDEYKELPFWVVDAIKHGWTEKSKYKTRSELDFAVMLSLLHHNFSDEMIFSIFTDERYKISEKTLEKGKSWRQYLEHTLSKAKEFREYRKQQWIEKINTFKDFQEVIEVYKKWLWIEDEDYLKIIHACLIAHKFDAKPVWLIALAPPSMTKTSVLQDLVVLKKYNVHLVSELTAKTLVSGDKHYAGLLSEIKNGIILFKDFTTILQLDATSRSEILQQLRECWDGQYSKSFGTGKRITWEGKITVLAGGTEAYEVYRQVDQTLGERFIIYRPIIENREQMTYVALTQLGKEQKMRKEIQEAIRLYHESIDFEPNFLDDMIIDENTKKEICAVADLITLFRSGVKRDARKQIEYIPQPEAPTRLAQQITLLAFALSLLNKHYTITEEELNLVKKVALMTIPLKKYKIIKFFCDNKNISYRLSEISEKLNIPVSTLFYYLEEMWCFKVLTNVGDGNSAEYHLSSEIYEKLKKARL